MADEPTQVGYILQNGCAGKSPTPFLPSLVASLPAKEMDTTEFSDTGRMRAISTREEPSYMGLFRIPVEKYPEDYIKPQENGSHYGC